MRLRRWTSSVVIGLLVLAATQVARAEGDQTNQLQQMAGQQLGQMAKIWRGMVFGPESFRKAITPNPDGEPNSVTISAYTPALSDKEMVELALAKVALKWGKRGDVGLYFPLGIGQGGKKTHFLFGAAAEKYIKSGGDMRGFATVGMPVDDFGAANFAKNVATVNIAYAGQRVKRSKVFRRALKAIARSNPALRTAARRVDLSNQQLIAAMVQRAASDKKLARAMAVFSREMNVPTAFVVNSGFRDNDNGMVHYAIGKRRANEARSATSDKVVAKKVADLVFAWWMKALPQAKKNGTTPRLFDVNHCAGVYDAADWIYMLRDRLKREAPKLLKTVLRRTYSYDLGAGATRAAGVNHLVQIGAADMFGQLNTPSSVIGRADLVRANHMLNVPLGRLNPDKQPALELRPFAQAFKLRLYDPPSSARLSPRANARRRAKYLRRLALRLKLVSRDKGKVLRDLRKNSPKEDKAWATYKLAEANLVGTCTVLEAKAKRATALSAYLSLKARGIRGTALRRARSKVRSARRAQRAAERKLVASIKRLSLGRNTMTDALQYQAYIHAGQGTARQKLLQSRGPRALRAHQVRAAAYGKLYQRQMVGFYARARAAVTAARQAARK